VVNVRSIGAVGMNGTVLLLLSLLCSFILPILTSMCSSLFRDVLSPHDDGAPPNSRHRHRKIGSE
jgi:hypothetical protein